MPEITITLTDDESKALISYAANERRDPSAQAAVFISKAVGCWHAETPANQVSKAKRVRHKQPATNGGAGAEL